MWNRIKAYFEFERHRATLTGEVTGGVTTFMTMAYIIIVNPKILEAAGMPFGASMVATILTAFFGTLAMGVYARRPFAVAPYMGENAFIAYTVVRVLGYSWETALGAIFIGGVLFTLLTVLHIRSWLADAIPESLKIGFAVGIGLFLTFIGLNDTGIIRLGVEGAPVHVGDFHRPEVLLAIAGFLLMAVLMIWRVPASIMVSILAVSVVSALAGLTTLPASWVSLPPDIAPVLLKLDIAGALTWGFFAVVLTIFVMDFVDTLGTLIGLAVKAELLDEQGNLPEIEKPMLCDALATTAGALLGTTTAGAYIESATGIAAGGRTGVTAVVTALLFLAALFFAPLFAAVPPHAYGPALVMVGFLMITPITRLKFDDLSETVPVFTVIALMSFTYNIGVGMTAGFVTYPLFKMLAGQARAVRPGMWALALMSLLFFIFYPY